MARAVKRLYEVHGIEGQGNRGDLTCATVAQVSAQIGKSERTVKTLRTIADLIPELSAYLDKGLLTQGAAYQLAQMDADAQKLVVIPIFFRRFKVGLIGLHGLKI
jgi:hypothetical protein